MTLIRCPFVYDAGDSAADSAARSSGCPFLMLRAEGVDSRLASGLTDKALKITGHAIVENIPGRLAGKADLVFAAGPDEMHALASTLQQTADFEQLALSLRETLLNVLRTRFTLRCRKKILPLGTRSLVMGVLNVTPDSFSDGGLFYDREKAVAQGLRMAEEGADLLDIGGESTRPGSKTLLTEEELRRVIPVIESLAKRIDVPLSIDTTKADVAQRAIEAGAEIVNDISGLRFDPALARVAAKANVPLILMHIRGTPETMQRDVHYDSLFSEILLSLKDSIRRAESAGVDPNQIVIDPGIGFGKTMEQNLLLVKHLSEFRVLGKPILLGTSRKAFLGKILDAEATDRLEGTLSSIAIGVFNGAHIIRCHDVRQAEKTMAVADAIRLAGFHTAAPPLNGNTH
jgi:dihydropteroate synthase